MCPVLFTPTAHFCLSVQFGKKKA
uniref:Uncharacterized protein n=1 Tax=Anguilla anguilla TaxID=7936 RepID=A0A0E9PFN4_ANGAN